MKIYWKDMATLLFIWLLGGLAVGAYPVKPGFTFTWKDHITMLLLLPYGTILTAFCLVVASFLLYSLLTKYGVLLLVGDYRLSLPFVNLLFFLLCLYILLIQGHKFPLFTICFFLFLFLASLGKTIRYVQFRLFRHRQIKK